MIAFRVLGPFEVVEADRPVAVGGPKQRALLAVLVLHRGEVVSSDRLIDELWGERPPATAAKTIQVFVSEPAQGARRRLVGHPRARLHARHRPRAGRSRPL